MARSFRDVKTTSFVSEGTELNGVLEVQGGIRIDGRVRGEIHSASVVYVGDQADIEADIEAEGVIASGRIKGNLHAARQVMLNVPGSVSGSIATRELILEKGVYFDGSCTILEPDR